MKKVITYLLFIVLLTVFIFLAWYKLGAFFCNQGNYYLERLAYGKAASCYKRAIKINPKAWMAYLGLADTYRAEKNYQAAVQAYEEVININPSFLRAYEFLADIYYQQGNYQQAQEVLLNGQKENPEDEKIKDSLKSNCFAYFANTLAKSTDLFISKKNKEAIALVDNILKICPQNALAYYTLGYYYLSSQDYNNAEINLNKSLEIDPSFYHSYKLLSEIYTEKKDIEKAIFFAQKVVNLNNNDASGYHNLGLLLMRLERYNQALSYLQRASSLAPDNANYAYSLASTYRDNKMYNQAVEIYKKLIRLSNDFPNIHNDLADIYIVLGQHNQARLEYQAQLEFCQIKLKDFPDNPVILNNYAIALNGLGEYRKAKKVVEELIVLHPQYKEAYLTLSRIYEKINEHDLALKSLDKAKQFYSGENFVDDEISRLKNDPSAKWAKQLERWDWIYLKNGRKLKGKIIKEYTDKIILEVWLGSAPGKLIFYRDSIERIEKEGEDL